MKSADIIFEAVNGTWTLLTAFFVLFLIFYFWGEWGHRRLSWRSWGSLPLGMRVAISLFVADFGTVISRAAAWHWRVTSRGELPLTDVEVFALLIGTAVAAIGILCQIRLFTSAYFGHWPWIMVASAAMVYAAMTLMPLLNP